MRRLFRWAFRMVIGLMLLALLLVIAGILLIDTLTRELLVRRLQSQTGMEVKVSAVHVGLLSPTISIEGLKLYNEADFGGAVCLDMPELHLEYDVAALRARQLHLKLLRLDVEELSVVIAKGGRANFDRWKKNSKEADKHKGKSERLKFSSIDVLNVTLGKFHVANQITGRSEEVNFGRKNQILRNVKTGADLSALGISAFLQSKSSSNGDAELDFAQVLESLFK